MPRAEDGQRRLVAEDERTPPAHGAVVGEQPIVPPAPKVRRDIGARGHRRQIRGQLVRQTPVPGVTREPAYAIQRAPQQPVLRTVGIEDVMLDLEQVRTPRRLSQLSRELQPPPQKPLLLAHRMVFDRGMFRSRVRQASRSLHRTRLWIQPTRVRSHVSSSRCPKASSVRAPTAAQ